MKTVLGTEISIGGRRWSQKLNEGIETERLVYTIVQRYDLPEIIARLLVARDVSLENVNGFLNPKIRDIMPDPSSLMDMDVAVDRLVKAISDNELIGLFADYDVDGATSSALLKMYLKALNIRNELYIPDRIVSHLLFWKDYVSHCLEVPILSLFERPSEVFPIYTDASLKALGIYVDGLCACSIFPSFLTSQHITVKEAYAALTALYSLRHHH